MLSRVRRCRGRTKTGRGAASTLQNTRNRVCDVRLSMLRRMKSSFKNANAGARASRSGPLSRTLSPGPNPLSVLSETRRMAPGTQGEGRPAGFERPHAAEAAGLRGMSSSLRSRKVTGRLRPCHARLLRGTRRWCCDTIAPDSPSGPARGMPFVRFVRVPVASRKDISF
jgi:hypothetical protein